VGENLVRWSFLNKYAAMPINGEGLKTLIESTVEIKKGVDYAFYDQWLGDGLLLSHDESWRVQRKMLTPVFHFNKLSGYMDAFNRHAKIFVTNLSPLVGRRGLTDIHESVSCCTLDVIGEAMGLPLDSQGGERVALGYVQAVKDFNLYSYYNSSKPLFWIPIM